MRWGWCRDGRAVAIGVVANGVLGYWSSGVLQPRREVGTGRPIIPILHYSDAPTLRVARFEDEDDEENENEVAGAARYTPSLGPVWPRIFTV